MGKKNHEPERCHSCGSVIDSFHPQSNCGMIDIELAKIKITKAIVNDRNKIYELFSSRNGLYESDELNEVMHEITIEGGI